MLANVAWIVAAIGVLCFGGWLTDCFAEHLR